MVSGWINGSAIVLGTGLVLAIFSRRVDVLWRDRALDRLVDLWREWPYRAALVVALIALALYLEIAHGVFGQRPLFIDELTQALQAQILASGALWRASGPHPEFFSSLLMADAGGRHFSQFPAGGPAMLVPGVLLGAPWIMGPLYAAIAVMAFATFVRIAEPRPGVAMCATVLFAFAPFALFMSGTQMNHVPTLMWIVIAMAAMAHVMTSDVPRPGFAFLNGIALSCAATIRPVDALAFALPAGAWYLARALRVRRHWRDALAAAGGIAIPLAVLLWINHETTGKALLFGYELLWGKSHGLGFHPSPWGMVHTPARGLELVNSYLLQLQTYLFESPLPSLLPAIGALALTKKLEVFDRYLLASSGLLLALYFGYWHDGAYLGPRFVYLLLPTLALYTARFFPLMRDRFGTGLPYRTVVYAAVCSVLIAATTLVPLRAHQYANSQTSMRRNADSAAAAARVDHALVFVRESWGAQLIARLWALDISRSETEMLYRSIDACMLEQRLGVARIRQRARRRGLRAASIAPPRLGATREVTILAGQQRALPPGDIRTLRGAQQRSMQIDGASRCSCRCSSRGAVTTSMRAIWALAIRCSCASTPRALFTCSARSPPILEPSRTSTHSLATRLRAHGRPRRVSRDQHDATPYRPRRNPPIGRLSVY